MTLTSPNGQATNDVAWSWGPTGGVPQSVVGWSATVGVA